MQHNNSDYENLTRTKPLVRTVSNLRNVTNNIRMFADSFEQLLNSVENFAPSLEIAAKGKDIIVSKMAPPPRRPPVQARPKPAPEVVSVVEEEYKEEA
ncbi:MAG: hypothetical protein ACOYJ1_07145 [Peptococcales bacterium]